MTTSNTTETRPAHIVAIRRDGALLAYQLRVGSGGAGQSKLFSVGKLGGPRKALNAARQTAEANGMTLGGKRGGSPEGRRNSRSPSPAAGLRFEWQNFAQSTVLYVVATWKNERGVSCSTRYSVDRHGLPGALDKAIEARTSCGAPQPDRKALLKALKAKHAEQA